MISKVNKNYCYEPLCNIENYKVAVESNKTWVIHHRLETHDSEGRRRLVDISATELIMLDMYYNRPASELIFLEMSEHLRLHKIGKKFSDGLRLRLSKLHIGKHISEEQKQKISKSNVGKHSKKVMCVETGTIYKSLDEAVLKIGFKSKSSISNCIHGYSKTAYGYHWKLV